MTTISFSCKQIDFKDLVMCSFALNKTEYNLLLFLIQHDSSMSASKIGHLTGKDRTTIQKAIKKLNEKGLVQKHQINLDTGGYTFVYKVKNRDYLRQTMLEIVNTWYEKVIDTIKQW